jgi:choline dehydrogenase-like flavoprotein
MDVSYIPAAISHGASVWTSVQVQRVRASGTRAYGVEGQVVAPFTGRRSHRVRVDAKIVVLAAGCMATPVLLQRSGDLANRSGQVGRNLQFHPGTAAAGVFSEPVDPLFGGTQSYQSLHHLRDGFKLETLWTAPPALAVRMPGVGTPLARHLAEMPRTVLFDAICSTHRSLGTVRARARSLDPVIHWKLDAEDAAIMLHSVEVLCRLLHAAGAERILPGVHGLPDEISTPEEIDAIASREAHPSDFTMASSHVFCTTRMHGRAEEGAVDETGRCHALDNLYIADTGVFPRCTSVNPMFTVMALAHRQGEMLANRL